MASVPARALRPRGWSDCGGPSWAGRAPRGLQRPRAGGAEDAGARRPEHPHPEHPPPISTPRPKEPPPPGATLQLRARPRTRPPRPAPPIPAPRPEDPPSSPKDPCPPQTRSTRPARNRPTRTCPRAPGGPFSESYPARGGPISRGPAPKAADLAWCALLYAQCQTRAKKHRLTATPTSGASFPPPYSTPPPPSRFLSPAHPASTALPGKGVALGCFAIVWDDMGTTLGHRV